MREIFGRAIRARRRSLIWWCVGVAAYAGMIMAFYPSIRQNAAQFNDMIANYPKGMLELFTGGATIDFASPTSFLTTYLYGFLPIMVMVLAIGLGASEIAGEEQAGTLELTLAQPVRRRTVVVAKAAVVLLALTLVSVSLLVAVVALAPAVSMTLPYGNLVQATIGLVLLGLDVALVALAVGAASGSRGLAIGVGSGVAAATYLINAFAGTVQWVRPLRVVSPFYWGSGGDPLTNGLPVLNFAVLAGIAVAAAGVAVVLFERRDLHG